MSRLRRLLVFDRFFVVTCRLLPQRERRSERELEKETSRKSRRVPTPGTLRYPLLAMLMLFVRPMAASPSLTAPILEDSPRLDEIATDLRPLLAWDNSEGGAPPRTYVLELDTSPSFRTANRVQINSIPEGIYVTTARLQEPLRDGTRWFWRVKAVDSVGNESPWSTEFGGVTAHFFLDTSAEKKFEYLRVSVANVATSRGQGTQYILDYDDDNRTCWEGAAHESSHWVLFDLGEPQPISRIFLVSGLAGRKSQLSGSVDWSSRSNLDGRLAAFVWQRSDDGKTWADIPGTERKDSNSFREILQLDETAVTSRYFRLLIKAWHGPSPRIYNVMLYRRGQPPVPPVPSGNFVLVIRNTVGFRPQPGAVQTDFGKMVRGLEGHVAPPWDLQVVELPAYAFSPEILNRMNPKPVAIFLSGSGNHYCQLPFFEFSGEFELIRSTGIPTYGSCAGVQLMAMAYGHTFAAPAGRTYSTGKLSDILDDDVPFINIERNDPLFAGMNNPFYATQSHSWAVRVVPPGWEVLASSRDSRGFVCTEMIKSTGRPVYGSQFHPEMPRPFSGATPILMNFLARAVERARRQGGWIDDPAR